MQVLQLEPENVNALKATAQLKSLYGDFPPANATRLHIEEEKSAKTEKKREKKIAKKETKTKTIEKQTIENTGPVETSSSNTSVATDLPKTKPVDYDLADLIKPNRLVKNKLASAAAALSNMKTMKQPKQQSTKTTETTVPTTYPNELRLPSDTPKAGGKMLIQEI
uniref:Uncharacterized protein n=1 Tax=Bactrocera dorsalis TaxID=27457 RepID=A0A034VEV2_BACDO